ncbi:alpha/beta hydrolase, partial [Schleiferilactobacillus harbinensis]|nr:alpha/beta hydrolase [Schleiferilactobacillus harbinensis]
KNRSSWPILLNRSRWIGLTQRPLHFNFKSGKIVGPDAQHSKLHENPEVDRLLIKFLWQ